MKHLYIGFLLYCAAVVWRHAQSGNLGGSKWSTHGQSLNLGVSNGSIYVIIFHVSGEEGEVHDGGLVRGAAAEAQHRQEVSDGDAHELPPGEQEGVRRGRLHGVQTGR